MKSFGTSEPTRRSIIKNAGAVTAIAAGGSLWGFQESAALEKILARTRASGKPPLTVATLNALLAKDEGRDALLAHAHDQPKDFVLRHFALTPTQRRDLASLSPDDFAAIQSAVEAARHKNMLILADCGTSDTHLASAGASEVIATSTHFEAASWTAPTQKITLSFSGFSK